MYKTGLANVRAVTATLRSGPVHPESEHSVANDRAVRRSRVSAPYTNRGRLVPRQGVNVDPYQPQANKINVNGGYVPP